MWFIIKTAQGDHQQTQDDHDTLNFAFLSLSHFFFNYCLMSEMTFLVEGVSAYGTRWALRCLPIQTSLRFWDLEDVEKRVWPWHRIREWLWISLFSRERMVPSRSATTGTWSSTSSPDSLPPQDTPWDWLLKMTLEWGNQEPRDTKWWISPWIPSAAAHPCSKSPPQWVQWDGDVRHGRGGAAGPGTSRAAGSRSDLDSPGMEPSCRRGLGWLPHLQPGHGGRRFCKCWALCGNFLHSAKIKMNFFFYLLKNGGQVIS